MHYSAKPETDKVTHMWLAHERHKRMLLCGPIRQAQATNNGNSTENKLLQVSKCFTSHFNNSNGIAQVLIFEKADVFTVNVIAFKCQGTHVCFEQVPNQ